MIAAYNIRKRLAGLGFVEPLSELPSYQADIFILIESEIQKLESKSIKDKAKK